MLSYGSCRALGMRDACEGSRNVGAAGAHRRKVYGPIVVLRSSSDRWQCHDRRDQKTEGSCHNVVETVSLNLAI